MKVLSVENDKKATRLEGSLQKFQNKTPKLLFFLENGKVANAQKHFDLNKPIQFLLSVLKCIKLKAT
ncbi:MAG: hypothetical protein AB8B69_21590 [Chitinophagales bacterium]